MKLNYLPVGKAFESISEHSLLLQMVKIEKSYMYPVYYIHGF